MKITETDWAWAAGYFEGEGCITIRRRRPEDIYRSGHISLHVVSADRDVLERLRVIVGVGSITGPFMPASPLSKKPLCRWQVAGKKAEALCDNHLFVDLLGGRRRARIAEIRKELADQPSPPMRPSRPLRPHCSRGHLYDDENTRRYPGRRVCKTCQREAGERWRRRQGMKPRVYGSSH